MKQVDLFKRRDGNRSIGMEKRWERGFGNVRREVVGQVPKEREELDSDSCSHLE